MKRAQKFVTIATVSAMVLGSTLTVLADVSPETTTIGVAINKPTAEEPAAEEPAAAEEGALELAYEETHYYNDKNADLGVYPAIADMPDLTKQIVDTIWKNYDYYNRDMAAAYDVNTFKVAYEVENVDGFAKVTLVLNYNKKSDEFDTTFTDKYEFYVDIANAEEATAEQFEAAAAPAAEEADEAPAEEAAVPVEAEDTTMLALRANAEALGFELVWNAETSSVDVVKDGNVVAGLAIGSTVYTKGEETVELGAAPAIQEEYTYVPASFFIKVLGFDAVKAEDGTMSFKLPVAE